LNITIEISLNSHRVIRELDQLIDWRGKPERIRVINVPEFITSELAQWAKLNGIELQLRKDNPSRTATLNGSIDSFERKSLMHFASKT
jgi:putative transposase